MLGHQVKGKDMARRKSFLRAMNYVHNWNDTRSRQLLDPGLKTNYTPSLAPVPTPNALGTPGHTTHMARLPAFYDNNSRGMDLLLKEPTVRDKLTAAILESAVDKSLAPSRKGSDSKGDAFPQKAFPSVGSIMSAPAGSPRKRGRHHNRQKSRLMDEMRQQLTKRGTARSMLSLVKSQIFILIQQTWVKYRIKTTLQCIFFFTILFLNIFCNVL